MQIKRFRARDIPSALRRVKEELGPEAVILATREIKDRGELGPAVEVTAGAGYTGGPAARAKQAYGMNGGQGGQAAAPAPAGKETPSLKGIEAGLAEIKEMLMDLNHQNSLPEQLRGRNELVRLYRELVDREVDPLLARGLVERVAGDANGGGRDPAKALADRLKRLLKVCRPFDSSTRKPRFVALTGPSGVGKTTTLAKIAAWFSVKEGRKTAIISLDTFRLGAADQLRTYARIMGLPVRVVQDREEFLQAVELFGNMDLVLIDTAGRCLTHKESLDELSGLLGEVEGAGALLVLSAATKDKDLAWAIETTSALPVEGLVITKLDESREYGNVINNLVRYKKPVAFLANGQKVPDDIEPATAKRLAGLILPGPTE